MKLLPIMETEKTNLHPETVCDRFSSVPDDDLAELAKSDREALAALYRRHFERIARYVVRRIRHAEEAEDVTSQVFMSMVRGLPKWKSGGAPFTAWLFRLATNAIISWNRRQKIRRWIGLSIDPVSSILREMDDVEELMMAMQQLREPYLSTVMLHHIEQLPVTFVAKVMGVSEGTVKSRLARGRSLLKQIIESKQN